MNIKERQQWVDGTQVIFTERAIEAMKEKPGRVPLRSPKLGTNRTYTIENTDDMFHDVILRETGERYGVYWLKSANEDLATLLLDEIASVGTFFADGDAHGS